MRIPSKTECFLMMRSMEMMEHIAAHSIMVCHVALLIADAVAKRGIPINRGLVEAAALLHDITKTRSLQTGENHARTGHQLLIQRGFDEVAGIVGQHVRLDAFIVHLSPTEAEIVNYADKRVLHDKVVSLDERMRYILERYGDKPEIKEKLRVLWEEAVALEGKLFAYLPFPPEALERFVPLPWHQDDLFVYRQT